MPPLGVPPTPDDVAEDISDIACQSHGAGQVDGYIRGWEEAWELAGQLVYENLVDRDQDLCKAIGLIMKASHARPAWDEARAESERRRQRRATEAPRVAAVPPAPLLVVEDDPFAVGDDPADEVPDGYWDRMRGWMKQRPRS